MSDTINGTNLTSENKNLDIHMEKNTEYGALALLSASSYGMGSTPIANGGTTTGNKTGVVMKINQEVVAAGTSETPNEFNKANKRYRDMYTKTYAEKSGDAIAVVGGWHGSLHQQWISYWNAGRSVLSRASGGSIFSYYGSMVGANGAKGTDYSVRFPSRAVVVVGSGV